jgi:hypothetical protein
MPLKKGSSKNAISFNVAELMQGYKKTGKIGTSAPKTKKAAQKQSVAIALSKAREAVERAGAILGEEEGFESSKEDTQDPEGKPFPGAGSASERLFRQAEKTGSAAAKAKALTAGEKRMRSLARRAAAKKKPVQEGKLCAKGKAAAKRKFDVYPSAYANMYGSAVCSGKVKPGGKKNK